MKDEGILTFDEPVTVEHSDGTTATYQDIEVRMGVNYPSGRPLPPSIEIPDPKSKSVREAGSTMEVTRIEMTTEDGRYISCNLKKEIVVVKGKSQIVYTVEPTEVNDKTFGFDNKGHGLPFTDKLKSERVKLGEVLAAILGDYDPTESPAPATNRLPVTGESYENQTLVDRHRDDWPEILAKTFYWPHATPIDLKRTGEALKKSGAAIYFYENLTDSRLTRKILQKAAFMDPDSSVDKFIKRQNVKFFYVQQRACPYMKSLQTVMLKV
jgi:hypothetical protein